MHLYISWRKLKTCIFTTILLSANKAKTFSSVHCVCLHGQRQKTQADVHRQNSLQHHLSLSSPSKHTLCILRASWLLAHISLVLFIVSLNTENVFEHICLFPLCQRHRCVCIHMHAYAKHSHLPYS